MALALHDTDDSVKLLKSHVTSHFNHLELKKSNSAIDDTICYLAILTIAGNAPRYP